MYTNAEQQDHAVIDAVSRIAEARGVKRGQVALAWLLTKSAITAPIVGATKQHHLADAIGALEVTLSEADIASLEAPYLPHPVNGIVPPLAKDPPTLTLMG